MATVVFLHGVGGSKPGWDEALRTSVVDQGGRGGFAAVDVDFRDLLDRPGIIKRRRTHHQSVPLVATANRAKLLSAYDERQAELRRALAHAPDLVERPTFRVPVIIPGELMVRLPLLGMREAGHYRHDESIRVQVLDRVARAVHAATGPTVLIAHSLGSVVALDALHTRNIVVDQLISIGSPLGVPDFWAQQWRDPDTFPYDRLGSWTNVVNVRDPAVLGWGAQDRFTQTFDLYISDGDGVTGPRNYHDAATYLGSAAVGRAVGYAFAQ